MPTIDVSKLRYKAIIVTENGGQIDLTPDVTPDSKPILTELLWEENRRELASRTSIIIPNIYVGREPLVNKIKLNQRLFIYADWGQGATEVFRGPIVRRNLDLDNYGELSLTAYDSLWYYQRSQDQLYISAGTTCKAAITRLLDRWNVPYEYKGPSTKMAKGRLFRSDTIAEIILTLLDEARQKGDGEYVVKDVQGTLVIEPVAKNSVVWNFTPNIINRVTDEQSIEDLVTRVKILSDTGDDQENPVDAVVNGKTEFGILQEIMYHDVDMSLAEAKRAAQTIINERGSPAKTLTFETIDIPPVRKGDKIQFTVGERKIESFVEAVQHNALQRRMAIEVKIT
jgi:hypothetical protein